MKVLFGMALRQIEIFEICDGIEMMSDLSHQSEGQLALLTMR